MGIVERVGFVEELFERIDSYLHKPTPTEPTWIKREYATKNTRT